MAKKAKLKLKEKTESEVNKHTEEIAAELKVIHGEPISEESAAAITVVAKALQELTDG